MQEALIITTLEKIEAYVYKNICNINYGGCGKLAQLVGKELLKRNIPHTLHITGTVGLDPSSHCSVDINSVVDIEKNLSSRLILASHIWIKVNPSYEFNSAGYTNYCSISISDLNIQRAIYRNLKKSYTIDDEYSTGIWSKRYNRQDDNKLRTAIAYYFKKYYDKQR